MDWYCIALYASLHLKSDSTRPHRKTTNFESTNTEESHIADEFKNSVRKYMSREINLQRKKQNVKEWKNKR